VSEEVVGRGATVLLSSHILAEVEALADRITIIRLGRRVETGTLDELRHLTRTSMTVTTTQPPVGLAEMVGVHDLVIDGNTARFEVEPDAMAQVQRRLADHGVTTMTRRPRPCSSCSCATTASSSPRPSSWRASRDRHDHPRPPGAPGVAGRSSELTGTWRLVRLALRRDRVLLPVWIVVIVGLLGATVGSIIGLYATEADRLAYATIAATNVVARAFDGPMSGTSLGAITMTESFGILAVLAGIMSVQAIVRHTRLEEETGRAELVGAGVVGRHAQLVAALLVVAAANLVMGIAVSVTLLATTGCRRRAHCWPVPHSRGSG
jgi:uncharacterized membrane protein HdeD (DUF308 family)